MVVVTHEMQFAREVANVLFFFNEGIIEEQGDPKELFTDPHSDRLRTFLARIQ